MREVTRGPVLSQPWNSLLVIPFSSFSAFLCGRASFSQASCSHEAEPRRQVAPGLDPHRHREEVGLLPQTHLEKPSEKVPAGSSRGHVPVRESTTWPGCGKWSLLLSSGHLITPARRARRCFFQKSPLLPR